MTYRMHWEGHRGLYVCFSGRITPLDFALLNREATRDARFGTARYAIGDFLAVEGHEFDLDDPESLLQPNLVRVGASLSTNPGLRVVLVTSDPAIRGLMVRVIGLGADPFRASGAMTSTSASDTPNQRASLAAYWSTAVVGMIRPPVVSSGPPISRRGIAP